jgi:hypothetical protein
MLKPVQHDKAEEISYKGNGSWESNINLDSLQLSIGFSKPKIYYLG